MPQVLHLNYLRNKRNLDPLFKNRYTNNLRIFDNSPAHEFPGADVGVTNDILGTPRTPVFDLGAYQSVPVSN
ncbi:MAG TPA: hypothetical protein PLS51_02045 [Flavobacterium sp.]|nr:hypothetical protein [Flavobacterium sp.]HPJ09383.1 hypothetical protein [Flavobacterium sp.]